MIATDPLPAGFYLQDTVTVARALLGCVLWRTFEDGEMMAVRIVETEAYLGANDPASHARRGLRSPRNESMYRHGGHAYVYFTYGMYFCMNVVTQEEDIAEAVLLRGGEPLRGIERMRRNRPAARKPEDLASGPGKLCRAMEIDRTLDGEWLGGPRLVISAGEAVTEEQIGVSSRIGVEGAGEAAIWPLRFFVIGNRHVSRTRPTTAARVGGKKGKARK